MAMHPDSNNTTMNIPQSAIDPFGVIGMPILQDYRNTIWTAMNQYASRCAESLEFKYRVMRPHHLQVGLIAVASRFGATNITTEFRDLTGGSDRYVFIVRMTIGKRQQGFPISIPIPKIPADVHHHPSSWPY